MLSAGSRTRGAPFADVAGFSGLLRFVPHADDGLDRLPAHLVRRDLHGGVHPAYGILHVLGRMVRGIRRGLGPAPRQQRAQ